MCIRDSTHTQYLEFINFTTFGEITKKYCRLNSDNRISNLIGITVSICVVQIPRLTVFYTLLKIVNVYEQSIFIYVVRITGSKTFLLLVNVLKIS